jgi:molybdopterin-guanine dinucleotide biosynthesis protein B
MVVIAVIGTSKSGKTTTIEYLTSQLSKEGFKIGSIKHIHHKDFSIDTEGTDTWRHIHAGAAVTVAIAPKEIVVIKKTDACLDELDRIIELLSNMEKLDVIFTEGFHSIIAKREAIPKIIAAKNPDDLKRTLDGTTPPILAVTGSIVKEKPKVGGIEIPIIDVRKDGDILLKLVRDQIQTKR